MLHIVWSETEEWHNQYCGILNFVLIFFNQILCIQTLSKTGSRKWRDKGISSYHQEEMILCGICSTHPALSNTPTNTRNKTDGEWGGERKYPAKVGRYAKTDPPQSETPSLKLECILKLQKKKSYLKETSWCIMDCLSNDSRKKNESIIEPVWQDDTRSTSSSQTL